MKLKNSHLIGGCRAVEKVKTQHGERLTIRIDVLKTSLLIPNPANFCGFSTAPLSPFKSLRWLSPFISHLNHPHLNSLLYFLYVAITNTHCKFGIITSRQVSVIRLAPNYRFIHNLIN